MVTGDGAGCNGQDVGHEVVSPQDILDNMLNHVNRVALEIGHPMKVGVLDLQQPIVRGKVQSNAGKQPGGLLLNEGGHLRQGSGLVEGAQRQPLGVNGR